MSSLLETATPEIRAKIKEGRKKADADLKAMEAWASGGFQAGIESISTNSPSKDA